MSYLKFIFHPQVSSPFSGNKKIEDFIIKAARYGYRVETIPLKEKGLEKSLESLFPETAAIVVAGGDGSLNWVVNTLLKKNEHHPPVGILPWGTSNDFAEVLSGRVDYSPDDLLSAIKNGQLQKVDLGCVNGERYFLNVAGAGLLVDVAHKTSSTFKQRMGMLAYYLEGARSFPAYKPFNLRIRFPGGREKKAEVYLFLVLNGRGAGGFRCLAPNASLDDGLMDLLIFKNLGGIPGLLPLFPRIMKGLHLDDPRVEYYQGKEFSIDGPLGLDTDIDGETGPPFPLSIIVHPKKMQFFSPGRPG